MATLYMYFLFLMLSDVLLGKHYEFQMMVESNEFKLNNAPGDGISSVKFGPGSSQFLLASSWDRSVRLYDVQANNMRLKYAHNGAVLDCCFYVSNTRVYKL